MKLVHELRDRQIKRLSNDDRYSIVGTEIKNRRKKKLQTLESLSDNICSLSYLCKIEKSQIEPNKAFLREICSRLELTDDNVDYLFSLKKIETSVVSAFLKGDIEYIEYAYEKGKTFDNYRYSIIKLAYLVTKNKIDEASIVYDNVMQIITSLTDYDLVVFSLFSSILLVKRYDFKEALDIMEFIDPSFVSKDAVILKALIEFKIHFGMNMADTPMYFEVVKRLSFEFGSYKLIEDMNYLMALYYIKNDCDQSAKLIINKMNEKKYINSLNCISAFLNNNITYVVNVSDELNDFAKMIKLICKSFNDAYKMIRNNKVNYYRTDYDELFLEYVSLRTSASKHDFIFKKGLPMAKRYDDGYLCRFFVDELSRIAKQNVRYKSLYKGYLIAHGEYLNLEEFEDIKDEEVDE